MRVFALVSLRGSPRFNPLRVASAILSSESTVRPWWSVSNSRRDFLHGWTEGGYENCMCQGLTPGFGHAEIRLVLAREGKPETGNL